MRYLIISDIHANWEALEAVLDDAGGGYDEILCCGDVVGYGADPNAAVDWVRDNVRFIVRGNHDKAAEGSQGVEWFNPAAQASTLWTREVLTPENKAYLHSLRQGPIAVGDCQLVHGSPLDEDDYVVTPEEASQFFGYLDSAVTFFGHTHIQGGFLLYRNGTRQVSNVPPVQDSLELGLSDDFAGLINPGSIGQPRDGDPRAAYLLYSPEERLVVYRRVPYDIEKAQWKIIRAQLPDVLATRLGVGS